MLGRVLVLEKLLLVGRAVHLIMEIQKKVSDAEGRAAVGKGTPVTRGRGVVRRRLEEKDDESTEGESPLKRRREMRE